ncbi:hypothetical protein [Polyangium jinanense]|uniref:Lipoprotein n=1 Tax=Polyangium jinanense TaxID=2829994 RepID=A0A9X3X6S4_9BACT|nr:hypothetical protein [Polyangium jinanense]MDC3960884.1 hypothetical protein [Polyangium jinanense]MDC3984707.1 hypothetical protein [Polyangium jinanense]
MKLSAWLVAFALLGAACSPSTLVQQGPSDTLRAYARALEEGRVDDAYRLLSDDAKRSMSLEAFRRAVKESPDEVIEIARAVSRPASDPLVTATVSLPNGDELLLVYEDGKWRIDAAAIDLYSQATPRQALAGFLRAFERKRYDVILRYVPDAEKEGITLGEEPAPAAPAENAPAGKTAAPAQKTTGTELTAEKLRTAWEGPQKDQINRIVQAIRTALPTAVIEETGDSASMSYGAGGTVALIREHGLWKIRDF